MRLIGLALLAAATSCTAGVPTYAVNHSWVPAWGSPVERVTAAAVIGSDVYAVVRGGTAPYSSEVFVLDIGSGKLQRRFGRGVLDQAHGAKQAALNSGEQRLFITDPGDFTIKLLDPINGHVLQTYGEPHKEGTGLDPIQFG